MEVDPVEKRAGDTLAITLHLGGAATAFTLEVAEVTARTGMHCHFVGQHYVGFVAPTDRITST
jgi:hypothetical protein